MGCAIDHTKKSLELILIKSVEYKLKLGGKRWFHLSVNSNPVLSISLWHLFFNINCKKYIIQV